MKGPTEKRAQANSSGAFAGAGQIESSNPPLEVTRPGLTVDQLLIPARQLSPLQPHSYFLTDRPTE